MTRLVGDAGAVLFFVAIVNDLAACGRLDGSAFDLDGADRLAIFAYGKSEDCRRVSLSRELAADDRDTRGRDALVGLGEDTDVQTPRLRDDRAALVAKRLGRGIKK